MHTPRKKTKKAPPAIASCASGRRLSLVSHYTELSLVPCSRSKLRFRTACVEVPLIVGRDPIATQIDTAAHRADVEEWIANYATCPPPPGQNRLALHAGPARRALTLHHVLHRRAPRPPPPHRPNGKNSPFGLQQSPPGRNTRHPKESSRFQAPLRQQITFTAVTSVTP